MNAEIILEQHVLGNGAEHCFYRRPHLENNPVCTFSAGSCRLEKGKMAGTFIIITIMIAILAAVNGYVGLKTPVL